MQHSPSPTRKLIALLVAVGIPFGLMIWYRVRQTTGFAGVELIVYPLVFGGGCSLLICLLKSHYLKEPLRDFNSGKGRAIVDVAWGLGLAAVYFLLFFVERATLAQWLSFRSNQELLGLMLDMREHPWMVVVWFGPVLWLGIALYEELVRSFLLTTLWSFSKSAGWVVGAVVISAVLIGLTHWSQGPYGVVTIGIKSLVAGLFYFKVRRLLPLVVAHVVYDGLQVALLLLTYPR